MFLTVLGHHRFKKIALSFFSVIPQTSFFPLQNVMTRLYFGWSCNNGTIQAFFFLCKSDLSIIKYSKLLS